MPVKTDLKLKANEFYYKNIWTTGALVKSYIDEDGNFTSRPSAFYIGTFDKNTEVEDFYLTVQRRLREHQEEYQVPGARSSLGGYIDQMRRTVEDWKK